MDELYNYYGARNPLDPTAAVGKNEGMKIPMLHNHNPPKCLSILSKFIVWNLGLNIFYFYENLKKFVKCWQH